MQSAKQRAPQLCLELPNVTADRGLRDMELLRRVGKAQAPRRCFKGAQRE
jgi:hypothetical protein